jgi:hypothetical protein
MFPAALNNAIDSGKMLQAEATHKNLMLDLSSEAITWRQGPDDTLTASIEVKDGSDVVRLHIPRTAPKGAPSPSSDFGVGYEFVKENFGGDIRMSEETRRILIEAGEKSLK